MPSKFSRLSRTKFGAASLHAAVLLFCIGDGSLPFAGAQQPTPTPATTPKPKQAFVRFWNMVPGKDNVLELMQATDKMIGLAAPGDHPTDYVGIAPGAYTFTVLHPTDVANPLKRLPINVPADSFTTILASVKGGQPTVEAINDTIDPKAAEVARLVLRQFVPGAHVTVAVGESAPSGVLNYGDSATLDNLPPTPVTINVRATFDKNAPKLWSLPADFSKDRRASLIIVTDSYGHFRPELTLDGKTPKK